MVDITAFLVAVGPLAIMVTKTVDTLRNLFGVKPKWVWNFSAFAVGVGYCLLFAVNLMGNIAFRPELVSRLRGTWGEVLTGLAIGGVSSFWHEHMDATSAKASSLKAQAPVSTQG